MVYGMFVVWYGIAWYLIVCYLNVWYLIACCVIVWYSIWYVWYGMMWYGVYGIDKGGWSALTSNFCIDSDKAGVLYYLENNLVLALKGRIQIIS